MTKNNATNMAPVSKTGVFIVRAESIRSEANPGLSKTLYTIARLTNMLLRSKPKIVKTEIEAFFLACL